MTDVQAYYTRPGVMTDPGPLAERFRDLPAGVASLRDVVQGVLLHVHWAQRYGVTLPPERQHEVQLRSTSEMLGRIGELDPSPLNTARPVDRRLVGNCRHFSTLLCAMLRHQGVPARARCGFGAYFLAGEFADHWVSEYWNPTQARWVMVDAQLDALQRQSLQLPFDPLDVPGDQFLVAGKAWQRCRAGQADPQRFGIFDMRGLWFIRGNLLRDLAALNRVELLPWDAWGMMSNVDSDLSEDDATYLDRIAALTQAGDGAFTELRALYEGDARLRVPRVVRSFTQSGVLSVTLPPGVDDN